MWKPNSQGAAFVVLVVLVTVAFIFLLLPFFSAVLWAVILAILFNPLQRWLVQRFPRYPNLAAAMSLLACICIVVIPGSLILGALAQEAGNFYQRISTRELDPAAMVERFQAALPASLHGLLETFNLTDFAAIQERFTALLSQVSSGIATRLVSIGQGTAQFFIGLGVMLYVLFFLFRDGPSIVRMIRKASPLSEEHTRHVMSKFNDVVKATVKGNFIIAALQGSVGGIAFWALGIEGALLWAVVMAVLSLLPAVGAFLVWAPVAAYMIISGDYLRGVLLIVIGVFIIGLLDNLLRPSLVGKGIRLPDYMVLVSTLGGLALFGMNGFVIGPLIAALFVAVWSLSAREQEAGRQPGA